MIASSEKRQTYAGWKSMLGAFGILGDLGKVLNDFLSVLRLAGTAFTAIVFFLGGLFWHGIKLFRILLGYFEFSKLKKLNSIS